MNATTTRYKGATITVTPTTADYRAKAEIYRNIRFWLNVRDAHTGNVYDMPVAELAKALRYVRKRILTARQHPKFGWAPAKPAAPAPAPTTAPAKPAVRDYVAIFNDEENHPLELRAATADEAKRRARDYMRNTVGHTRHDAPYKLRVRLAK